MPETHPGDDLVALALDDLDPRTRTATLAHLATCARCREEYDDLADTVEATLVAAPRVGPPAGFEERVLSALGIDTQPSARPIASAGSRRRRSSVRYLLLAAGAAVGLTLGAGGTYVAMQPDGPSAAPTAAAPAAAPGSALSTSDGAVVGAVTRSFLGGRRVYVVTVSSGPAGMPYTCELRLEDGRTVDGGHWALGARRPALWIIPAPRAAVSQVVFVANNGAGPVWSRATL
jgi:anti-sigma factor RsiW